MSVYTEDTKRVYTLLQELHELEKEVAAIHKEIDEKIGKIDLSLLATKAELNGLATKEEVNGLATKAELTNLQGQVTAVDSRVDSVGQEVSSQVTNLENLSAVTPTEIKSVVGADNIERLYLAHDGEVLTGQDGLDNRLVINSDLSEPGQHITYYYIKTQNVNVGSQEVDGDYYLGFKYLGPNDISSPFTFDFGRINRATGIYEGGEIQVTYCYSPVTNGLPYFGSHTAELRVSDMGSRSGILNWRTNSGYSVVSGTGIPVFSGTSYSFSTIDSLVSGYFSKASSNSTADNLVNNYFTRGSGAEYLISALSSTGKFHPQEPTILFYDGYTGEWSVTSVDSEQEGKDQMLVYNASTHGLEFRVIQ